MVKSIAFYFLYKCCWEKWLATHIFAVTYRLLCSLLLLFAIDWVFNLNITNMNCFLFLIISNIQYKRYINLPKWWKLFNVSNINARARVYDDASFISWKQMMQTFFFQLPHPSILLLFFMSLTFPVSPTFLTSIYNLALSVLFYYIYDTCLYLSFDHSLTWTVNWTLHLIRHPPVLQCSFRH